MQISSSMRIAIMAPRKNADMRPRARLQLDDYLPYLINRVGAALVARFTELALARRQLSIDMWRVLAALFDDGRRQIDLAGMTSIDASTISRIVTRLVHQGLVKRSRSRTTGREVVVELTVRGKALVDHLIPVALSVESLAVSGMPTRDLVRIKWLLRRVYANLAASP
jgi:DNA-binding MarR family transcriptional regulator